MAIACGVIGGVVTLALLFRLFFSDFEEFGECVRFWITPDIVSLFRGEFARDWFAEAKLGLWFALGGIVGFGIYALVTEMLSTA